MKKLFFLGACLVALASQPAQAQTSGPDLVVVKFYYTAGFTGRLAAIIARTSGTVEEQNGKDSQLNDVQFCQHILARFYQEGYTIKTALALGTTNTSTVVLTKEK